MIKAVIFDMDGVLVDSEPYYQGVIESYLKSYGVELTKEEMLRFPGHRFLVIIEELKDRMSEESYQGIVNNFIPWNIEYEKVSRPEVLDVFKKLKSMGMGIAIASNSTEEKIGIFLRNCGLGEYVDCFSSGAKFGRGKPEPDIYLGTCKQMGLEPGVCIAVEDSDCGLQAATSAGCKVVCLIDKRFAFRQENADIWIHNLSELPDVINRLNGMDGEETV